MKPVFIYSGTTEGRQLAACLSEAGIPCIVSVATEYGKMVMPKLPLVTVREGRMNVEEMRRLLEEVSVVVDATHPFAVEVTRNIQTSMEGSLVPYLRLKRDTKLAVQTEDVTKTTIRYFADSKECAEALAFSNGNILLTTGSKELPIFTRKQEVASRLYVRVLPSEESLRICREQGIEGKQIIAMQGPFSEEMNRALLLQYDISVMVTKESGRTGGFLEKWNVAKALGVSLYVIGSPAEEGRSFPDVCTELEKILKVSLNPEIAFQPRSFHVSLAGLGMGNRNTWTVETEQLVRRADYVFGAQRVLDAIPQDATAAQRIPFYLARDIVPKLHEIWNVAGKTENPYPKEELSAVIAFSGDSGFYSGCRNLYEALKDAPEEWKIQIVPGISSVSYLAAATGVSWQDAYMMSTHGRAPEDDWRAELFDAVRYRKKVYVIVSGVSDMQKIGTLFQKEEHIRIYVGYQLSYDNERIFEATPLECSRMEEEGLYTCLICNESVEKRRVTHGFADGDFLRGKVPMTKEEVREISISKLHLTEHAVVYDIGSGTGSIAVEIAASSSTIRVYAIEKKAEAVALIKQNAEHFQLSNIRVIHGLAPEALLDLPVPTHAFIGGSSGNLKEIISCLREKNPKIRIVVNAISMETIRELTELLTEEQNQNMELTAVNISRSKRAGNYHLMEAENPVYVAVLGS